MSLCLLVFTVLDSAANAYLPPFFAPTLEVALRRFRETVNSPADGNQIAKYPEDYTLFQIGEFDQEQGRLIPIEPRSLGVAITFRDAAPSTPVEIVKHD